jgi:hypothetical protein
MHETMTHRKQTTTRRYRMFAHYTTYTTQGKKVHMISITSTPSMREGSEERKFDTAKEAKQYAKSIGAKAWNY